MSAYLLEQKGNETMEPIRLYRIITMKPVTWQTPCERDYVESDNPRHWHSQSCCLTLFWVQLFSALPSFLVLGIEISFGK